MKYTLSSHLILKELRFELYEIRHTGEITFEDLKVHPQLLILIDKRLHYIISIENNSFYLQIFT